MLGTFQRAFSNGQLPRYIFPSGIFLNLQFHKRQLSKSVISQRVVVSATLGPTYNRKLDDGSTSILK